MPPASSGFRMFVVSLIVSLLLIGGPFDSKVGLLIANAGFKSNMVRGLIATMLAPIGPVVAFIVRERESERE